MKIKQNIGKRCRTVAVMAVAVVAAVAAVSCSISYKMNGAALDYSIYKTISISEFPIRAALVYPPLQQTFENKMIDMVTRQTRLRVIDSNNSDLRLEGEITGYSLSPQAVNDNAYASQTRLTITVRVKFINSKDSSQDVDQTFSAYRDFSSDQMLTDVQDELCSQISDELTNLIFNATLGNW
ncbi:MAG: LptE family protein [Muribaculaceae bacterium]|nr:LptE family protein [Muribaculaceae bacterium]